MGRDFSLLYGLNTLGAVVGCSAAGFVLIGFLGMRATTWIAVFINLLVGVLAILLGAKEKLDPSAEPLPAASQESTAAAGSPAPSWFVRLLLVLFFFAGLTALAYQVLWTRVLTFLTGGTSYAFTSMLAMYLSGLAIGSVLIAPGLDRSKNALKLFCALELMIGLGVLLTVAFSPMYLSALGNLLLVDGVDRFSGLAAFVILQVGVSAFFVFPVTLLMGMAFPVMTKLCAQTVRKSGEGVGTTYFADTVGCIVGSLAAGFILIPRLGTLHSLELMVLFNMLIAAAAFGVSESGAACLRFSFVRFAGMAVLLVIACLGSGMAIPADVFSAVFTAPGSKLVYLNEDIGGTVTIEDYGTHRTLSINGINVAGTDLKFMTTQKLQAHLAMLLHPNPQSVLQIGFGSGGTAWSISRHPVAKIDCVEITAAVLKANDLFRESNHGVLADKRVKVIVDDARSYLQRRGPDYDVILSDSVHPRRVGNGGLYSSDYFRLCRNRLKPGGIFSA